MLGSADYLVFNELSKSLSMGSVFKLEIQALSVVFVPDVGAFLSRIMFQNELLKKQKGSLMVNFLAHLNLRLPKMGRVCLFAIITLEVGNYEFNNKCLLQEGAVKHFFLNCDFNLKSSGVRFSPDEYGVYHFYSFKAFDVLQAQGKKLSRFKFALDPWRSLVTIAFPAVLKLN